MLTRRQVLYHMFYDMRGQAGESFVADDRSAIAMYTPGKPLWLWLREGWNAEDLRSFFCGRLSTQLSPLTGLVAEKGAALLCADWYALRTGAWYTMREMVAYYLVDLKDHTAQGRLRPASGKDADYITDWLSAFYREAFTQDAPATGDTGPRIPGCADRLYVWEDGTPVAMGMLCGHHAATRRLNLIYTKEDCRRHGYGRSITAALARLALFENGIPVLYTFAGNTAANQMYRSLGFEEAGRLTEVTFDHMERNLTYEKV